MHLIFTTLLGLMPIYGFAAKPNQKPQEAAEAKEAPKAEASTEPATDSRPEVQVPARFFIGASYNSANKIKFDDVKTTSSGTSTAGTASFDTETALGLVAGVAYMPPNSWGGIGSLAYEFERNVKSGQATSGGGVASVNYSEKPRLSFIVMEGSAVYRWDKFYLPFGFNYCLPIFFQPANALPILEVQGGLGAQFGVGYFFDDNITLEVRSRALSATAKGTNPPSKIEYGTGYLTGIDFIGRYWF